MPRKKKRKLSATHKKKLMAGLRRYRAGLKKKTKTTRRRKAKKKVTRRNPHRKVTKKAAGAKHYIVFRCNKTGSSIAWFSHTEKGHGAIFTKDKSRAGRWLNKSVAAKIARSIPVRGMIIGVAPATENAQTIKNFCAGKA